MAILVRIGPKQQAQAKIAAKAIGVTLQEFCRRAVVDAAAAMIGPTGTSMQDLVREIHRAVCAPVTAGDEITAAVHALVLMQIPRQEAQRKVAKITAAAPDLSADEIIRAAMKMKG